MGTYRCHWKFYKQREVLVLGYHKKSFCTVAVMSMFNFAFHQNEQEHKDVRQFEKKCMSDI